MGSLLDEQPDNAPSDTLVDTLRLSLVSGVGPRIRKALLERFGSARAALAAAPSELREVQGVGPEADAQDRRRRPRDRRRGGDRLVPRARHRHSHRGRRRLSAGAPRDSRSAGRAVRPRRAASRTTPWRSASSARGTARSTACGRPSGWPAAWPGRD